MTCNGNCNQGRDCGCGGAHQAAIVETMDKELELRHELKSLKISKELQHAGDDPMARIAALEAENARLSLYETTAKQFERMLHGQAASIAKLRQQLETAREALKQLACLGNGDRPGNSVGNVIAQKALTAIGEAQPASAEVKSEGEKPFSNWLLGDWFKAKTIDDMEAFYWSRLPAIREAARERGYAIGLHGSMRRDFDLMAMPWREDASDIDVLAHAIVKAACGITRDGPYQWEEKPLGRMAVSIPICWADHSNPDFKGLLSVGHIDLSVIPAQQPRQESEIAALFNGFDITKLPPILISLAAKLSPGSGGIFWELAIEHMPNKVQAMIDEINQLKCGKAEIAAEALEEAANACREQSHTTDHPGEFKYRNGCYDCETAIRRLATQKREALK